ncbi:unnamed protein product [Oncorhynchus mykiss]|uniref:Biogenesis of lysosome-related organelles complex 1 subunit 7 n=1 Tax=Oncorhynchus mykiss TaxID=8022 RepID=A0A060VQX0_ONCMY|nr:unnamed protein product [Oncorhynchus mykiss]
MAAALAVVETPSGKDAIAEGLLDLLKPAVQQLDLHVHSVRESQVELREHIDNLATELCRINEHQKVVLDLDPYVKKLLNARRRVVLVNNILQNAQVSGSKQELGCFLSYLPVLFCGPSFTPVILPNTLFMCHCVQLIVLVFIPCVHLYIKYVDEMCICSIPMGMAILPCLCILHLCSSASYSGAVAILSCKSWDACQQSH